MGYYNGKENETNLLLVTEWERTVAPLRNMYKQAKEDKEQSEQKTKLGKAKHISSHSVKF